MSQAHLTIAQASFTFHPSTTDASIVLHPDYEPFLRPTLTVAEYGGNYVISPSIPDNWSEYTISEYLWDSHIWRLGYAEDNSLILEVRNIPHNTYLKAAKLTSDFSSGTIIARTRPPQPKYALNHPEGELIFLNRLSHLGAAHVHSSLIVVDGKGYLFYGRSGAGKTTIGRHWKAAGFKMLCDDRNLIRLIDSIPYACSTPWHGEDPEVYAESVPLGAVFNLIQAPDNRLEELSYTEAIATIHSNTLAPFYLSDGTTRVLDVYAQTFETVPSYHMYFTPDQRAIEMCLAEVMNRPISVAT